MKKTYSSKSNESFTMGKYQCSQCDICFSTESSLNPQAIMHTGENSKECSINNDMEISTREYIYKCCLCKLFFCNDIDLKNHSAAHTSKENADSIFSCPECNFKCNQKSTLSKNWVSHKMLICSV